MLLSVVNGSILTGSEPFILPFLASLETAKQNILILSDKTVTDFFWVNLSIDRCKIQVAYDIVCSTGIAYGLIHHQCNILLKNNVSQANKEFVTVVTTSAFSYIVLYLLKASLTGRIKRKTG